MNGAITAFPQELREELQQRQAQHTSLQLLWSQLQPEEAPEDIRETREKIAVTGSKLKLLLQQADDDLGALQQRLVCGLNERYSALSALHTSNWPLSVLRTVRLRQTDAAARMLLQR